MMIYDTKRLYFKMNIIFLKKEFYFFLNMCIMVITKEKRMNRIQEQIAERKALLESCLNGTSKDGQINILKRSVNELLEAQERENEKYWELRKYCLDLITSLSGKSSSEIFLEFVEHDRIKIVKNTIFSLLPSHENLLNGGR